VAVFSQSQAMRIARDFRLCDGPRMNEPYLSDDALPLVDVVIEDDRWVAVGLDLLADRAVRSVLDRLGLEPHGFTLCLMGCDDARIAALNGAFRGKGKPTNVLSWPAQQMARATGSNPELPDPGSDEDPTELGDIALAFETCMAEAAAQDKSVEHHVTHLIVHGTLHLLGYDHVEDSDAALMETLEAGVLAPLGVSDPY
jgi:probable rRNA maturation factor